MGKLICIGESLIDFMPTNSDSLEFKAKAGGAPANVCACVARLGGESYYLGKLSNDVFSRFLLKDMQDNNINTDYVVIDEKYQTALAFVTLDENGDREFNFYRNDTCDLMLDESEIKKELFTESDILHFCSVGLVESKSKYAHKKAIEYAKQNKSLVSFDVNLRLNLWKDKNECVKTVYEFLKDTDLVKLTDDELLYLTKEKDEKLAVKMIFETAKTCKLIFVTKGENGSTVYDRQLCLINKNAYKTTVVDTTGAGDCFIGSVLYCILYKNVKLTIEDIFKAVDFASLACSIVVSKTGASESMPTLEEVNYKF